jgi:hypothetical protein
MTEQLDSGRMLGNRNQGWKTQTEGYSNMTSSRKEKSMSIDTGSRERTTTNGEPGTRLFLRTMRYLQQQ